ncbi:hypothetical protein HMPREF0731_4442, partial [Pseudoroseomonas cervicalis ATCC 49957]
ARPGRPGARGRARGDPRGPGGAAGRADAGAARLRGQSRGAAQHRADGRPAARHAGLGARFRPGRRAEHRPVDAPPLGQHIVVERPAGGGDPLAGDLRHHIVQILVEEQVGIRLAGMRQDAAEAEAQRLEPLGQRRRGGVGQRQFQQHGGRALQAEAAQEARHRLHRVGAIGLDLQHHMAPLGVFLRDMQPRAARLGGRRHGVREAHRLGQGGVEPLQHGAVARRGVQGARRAGAEATIQRHLRLPCAAAGQALIDRPIGADRGQVNIDRHRAVAQRAALRDGVRAHRMHQPAAAAHRLGLRLAEIQQMGQQHRVALPLRRHHRVGGLRHLAVAGEIEADMADDAAILGHRHHAGHLALGVAADQPLDIVEPVIRAGVAIGEPGAAGDAGRVLRAEAPHGDGGAVAARRRGGRG